jgi:hypothetical protein
MFPWTSRRVADLERENAVLRERERLVTEHNQRLLVELATLARKHDRLVEQRLYKQGDIATPITDTPRSTAANPMTRMFGNLGRSEFTPDITPGRAMDA